MPTCTACKLDLMDESFYMDSRTGRLRAQCKTCYTGNRTKQVTTPEQNFAANLKRCYGMTVEEYDALDEAQGGACAICGRTDSGRAGTTRLSVDHDHGTGEVRGLLCHFCNTALGAFGDCTETLLKAILYLEKSQ